MKKIFIFCFLFGFGIMSSAIAKQEKPKISFYLVKNKLSEDDIRKNNISGVILDTSPIFTPKDIVERSYYADNIPLTKEAYKNFMALKDSSNFEIYIDNQPVYLGTVQHKNIGGGVYGFIATPRTDGSNEIHLELRFFYNSEVSFHSVKSEIYNNDIHKNNLRGIVLDQVPVFTSKDIIEYSQRLNTIKLTKEAFKKFGRLNVFVICYDNHPAYLGRVEHPAYWSALPSDFYAYIFNDEHNEIQFGYSLSDPVRITIDGVPLPEVSKSNMRSVPQNIDHDCERLRVSP